MKQNYEICLINEKVTLVPYRPEHTRKYHEWMKDPALLEATDSEPLSFKEEVEMQQSWRDDPMKCTFIVHSTEISNFHGDDVECKEFSISNNLQAMVGDVNLFLSDIEESEQEGATKENDDSKAQIQAEIDIMVAENIFKRQGLGKAATCAMLLYGANELHIHRFFCKINEDNIASIKLFEGLGFIQCAYAACFKQVELEFVKTKSELNDMLKPFGDYKTIKCPDTAGDVS